MNYERLKSIYAKQGAAILPIKKGMQLEIHERVGEGSTQRTRRFKGLVIKVKKPNHPDGTFTIRGTASGVTVEKIYPLSFPNFEKVLLLDEFKVKKSKLYYIRDKIGKDARLKSKITADRREIDLTKETFLPEGTVSEIQPAQSAVVNEESAVETPKVAEVTEEKTEEKAETPTASEPETTQEA